jgi:hypothetical protein
MDQTLDGENFLEITAQGAEPILIKSMFGFLQVGDDNVFTAKNVLNNVSRRRPVLGIGHDSQDRVLRARNV